MTANKIQTGIRFEPELLYKITVIAKENVFSGKRKNTQKFAGKFAKIFDFSVLTWYTVLAL